MTRTVNDAPFIDELRQLIRNAAPDDASGRPVMSARPDEPLDRVMPFSSVVVLGVIVAIEDAYGISVTRKMFERLQKETISLRSIANLILRERNGEH